MREFANVVFTACNKKLRHKLCHLSYYRKLVSCPCIAMVSIYHGGRFVPRDHSSNPSGGVPFLYISLGALGKSGDARYTRGEGDE